MTHQLLFGREITRQFLTFLLVGAACTVLNYIVFLVLLSFFSVNYIVSAAIGFIAGVLFGFLFNKEATFRSDKKVFSVFHKYVLVYLFSLIVNITFLHIMVEYGGMQAVISNLILAPFIVIINFFGTKLFAFDNRKW